MKRLALIVLLFACKQTVDPDKGKYSCMLNEDCGPNDECWPQFQGGGLCFPAGRCTKTEVCNGKDDNCDGRIDEAFPQAMMACMTGKPGPCGPGTDQCIDGGVVCVSPYTPVAELCDGIDNDCNGKTDDTFNFAIDPAHCGTCSNACAAGAACAGGICFETNCADGIDNDHDGGADCADLACLGKACGGDDGGFNCGAVPVLADAGAPDAGDAGPDDGGPEDGGMLDAGVIDAGTVPACVPREAVCDNGFDDDLDGLTDCADPDCNTLTCDGGTCINGTCQ